MSIGYADFKMAAIAKESRVKLDANGHNYQLFYFQYEIVSNSVMFQCTLYIYKSILTVFDTTIEDFHTKTKKVAYLVLACLSIIRFSTLQCIRCMKIVAIGANIMMS